MSNKKHFFNICVTRYVPDKTFSVFRAASLDFPKNNSVMFITANKIEKQNVFLNVDECLIFWPEETPVLNEILHKHAVVSCNDPHTEYCRFFRDNNITNLPEKENVDFVGGAWISPKAVIGSNATVMPGAYISGDCVIGDNVYIGCGVRLIGEVQIGNRVVIRENSVIGSDGLSTDRETDGSAITMPQFGSVIIEDDVQIGALSVIARGAIDATVIKRGCKIDNCCFISHNVVINENTFVVGEVIMFGSSSTGKCCLISGNSTLMNAVHVGDNSIVGAGSVVTRSVKPNSKVKGCPAKQGGIL